MAVAQHGVVRFVVWRSEVGAVSAVVVRVDERDDRARVELAPQRNRLKRLDSRGARRHEDATAGAVRPYYPRIIDQAGCKNHLGLMSTVGRKRAPYGRIRLLGHPEITAHCNSRNPSGGQDHASPSLY